MLIFSKFFAKIEVSTSFLNSPARLAFNINCSNLESRNIFEAKTTFLNSGNRAITSTINERQRISGISLLNVRAE